MRAPATKRPMHSPDWLDVRFAAFVRTREAIGLGLLVGFLIICNIGFESTTGFLHIMCLAFGYGGLFAIIRYSRLTRAELGLTKQQAADGARLALYTLLPICAVSGLAFIVDPQIFKDPRYDNTLWQALFAALVVLPLQVVLFEELAFRGIALTLLGKMRSSRWLPVLVSSVLFGLWHILSSATIGSYSIGNNLVVPELAVMGLVLLATTAAGIVLAILRLRSKSLLAPILVHWFINGSALILASLAWHA